MADSSSAPPTSASPQDGSDFRPATTWWNRTVNFTRMLTGQMSPAGQKKYWLDADERYSDFDCKRCETDRDYLLKYSPVIRFMNENIQKLGGEMGPQNIHCRTCRGEEEEMQGGFDHKYGIKICANWVQQRSQLEDVMAHEMVHAYDHLRFKTNLTEEDDLKHAACSEVAFPQLWRDVLELADIEQIRASNLSGECRWANEFFRNKVLSFTQHQQDCVRRRAILSVKGRPGCKDDVHAVKVVNEVWDSCFRDTRPFDEIYR
ncbi:Mitochondrial inner membrane protease atp23 [Cladophialophora chaetospira]|uniref:Mitochondrial inner membrane protease ATP23 n=1 Tax=Cladophialophora chaetospira TaxID=386627 RepID=A0AA38XCS9_9EURO|nr:Mitochondrial inner membrane protease atp23 [Cladophialophora chaetospira]